MRKKRPKANSGGVRKGNPNLTHGRSQRGQRLRSSIKPMRKFYRTLVKIFSQGSEKYTMPLARR